MKILCCFILSFASVTSYAADKLILYVPIKKTDFEVVLPANPTTGYQWSVIQFNKKLFVLSSSSFQRSKNNRIGAAGEMHYRFTLLKGKTYPASSEMKFQYARSWEQKSGMIKTVKVNFTK